MLIWLTAALTTAGPLDGWEGSRWLLELEETFPVHLPIAGPEQMPPVLRAVQIQAVMKCGDFAMSGKKAAYVTCKAEDFALRASPQSFPGDNLDQYIAAVDGLRTALAGGTYEVKLKDDGRIASIDFREPPKTDAIAVEAGRSIAIDLFNGFALYREEVPPGAPWDETNSTLVRAPIQPLGNGKTKIRHQPITHEGKQLLQSTGDGTFTSLYLSWGAGRQEQVRTAASAGGQYGARGGSALFVTKTFDAVFNSIVFEGDGNGPFAERLWNLESTPKHDITDMTGITGTPLWTSGHIRRLEADEKPEIGASGLTSAPGAKFGELPDWTPMPTLGG